jgi:non-specific serine/threonine protein kinase
VTEDNATVIAQICVRLDGIPLALELTAARTRFLSLGEMASRLDDRFALLTAGGRTATPRHQTLRAAIDWSYNLLSEEERLLFGRLAVFAGGWTLEAAEAVCAGEGVETGEVLDVMSRLVDKSLVVVEKAGERVRYRLLETIRQYASEKLVESGERAALSKRHLEYFVQLAERAEPELTGAKQTHWLERVQREHDNLRAALEWCQQWAEGAELGLRLAGALQFFWHLHSYYSEGRRWLENMLELPAVRRFTAARAKALYGAGSLANLQGDYMVARSRLEESIALGQELGDKEIVAYGLHHRAITAMYEGDYTLWGSLLAQSVALFRETADMWGLAFSLCSLGYSATHLSDPVAGTVLEESQALSRRLGNTWGLARVLHVSGELARAHGEDARARALYEESLALYRELGHHNTAASVLWNLGIVAQHQRDVERAAACFSEGLALHRHYGDKRNMGSCIAGLAGVVAMRGQPERAARLFGAVQAWWDTLGTHLEPVDQAEIDRNIAVVRTAVGEHAFDTLWAEGRRMTLEQAVDLALLKV